MTGKSGDVQSVSRALDLLTRLGSPLRCLDTHFRGTGDYCPGSGVPPFGYQKTL